MRCLLFAVPVALILAHRIFRRKGYKVDGQGRYVLLDLHRPVNPFLVSSRNFFGRFLPQNRIDMETLIDLARQRSGGLTDFGDEERFPFRDGLEVFLRDVNKAPLTSFGRTGLIDDMTQYLVTRLQLEDLIKQHPEILDEDISSPVFVIGLARSGTTHMQRCLSLRDKLRSFKYYELTQPVVTQEVLQSMEENGNDIRLERSREVIEYFNKVKPVLKVFHTLGAEEIEEHIQLTACVCRSLQLAVMCMCPEYMEWWTKQDATVEFQYLRRFLQFLQWQDAQLGKGRRRLISKCPTDAFSLPCLKQAFPDAKIVHMHRDPATSLVSFLYLIAYANGLGVSRIDLKEYGRNMVNFLERMMKREVANGPQSGIFHVNFDDFVADNVKILKKVYEYVGLELDADCMKALNNFLEENKQHKFGKLVYDPSLFGFSMEELQEKFKFYTTRKLH